MPPFDILHRHKIYAFPTGGRKFTLNGRILSNNIIKKEEQSSEKEDKDRKAVHHPTRGAGRDAFRLGQGSFHNGLRERH